MGSKVVIHERFMMMVMIGLIRTAESIDVGGYTQDLGPVEDGDGMTAVSRTEVG